MIAADERCPTPPVRVTTAATRTTRLTTPAASAVLARWLTRRTGGEIAVMLLPLVRVGQRLDDAAAVDRWAEQHSGGVGGGVVVQERLTAPAREAGAELEVAPVDADHPDAAIVLHVGHRHRGRRAVGVELGEVDDAAGAIILHERSGGELPRVR